MCGGGGKSAQSIFKGMRVGRSQLPSLSMDSKDIVKRDGPSYGDVRTGMKRRSLLLPMLNADNNA